MYALWALTALAGCVHGFTYTTSRLTRTVTRTRAAAEDLRPDLLALQEAVAKAGPEDVQGTSQLVKELRAAKADVLRWLDPAYTAEDEIRRLCRGNPLRAAGGATKPKLLLGAWRLMSGANRGARALWERRNDGSLRFSGLDGRSGSCSPSSPHAFRATHDDDGSEATLVVHYLDQDTLVVSLGDDGDLALYQRDDAS